MNEELEKLIEVALKDGILTEKERQVLLKKADSLGVDKDEFEMVLESRLYEIRSANPEKKVKVIKCPSCGEPIPALSNICPSCDHVLSSSGDSQHNHSGMSISELVSNIEHCLVEIKSLPKQNALRTLFNNGFITIPLLACISFFLAIKFGKNDLGISFMIVAAVLGILGILLIIKKFQAPSKKNTSATTFESLKASLDKYNRTTQTYFGQNKKVKDLLSQFETDLKSIEQSRKANATINIVTYSLLVVIAVGVFFIPKPKSRFDIEKEKIAEISKEVFLVKPNKTLVNGDLASLIELVDGAYNLRFNKENEFSFSGVLELNNVKIRIKDKPTKAQNKILKENKTNNNRYINLIVDITDDNEMALPEVKTLSIINEDKSKLTDALLSGGGDLFVSFNVEFDVDKVDQSLIDQIKLKAKKFIVNSSLQK